MTNINLYDWSQTIGWTLFHSLWQAAIIGGLIWLIFRFISKDNARVRYALSGLGLVLICLASTITFYRYIPKGTNTAIADIGSQFTFSGFPQINESFFSQLWSYLSIQIENSFPILVNIWIIGMLFLSINLILKYINTQKLKKHLTFPLRSEYKEIADRIINKYQLKQKVIFKESGYLEIPSVIGYFKPVVLLPVSMLSGIPENQLEIIIAHELAHIRRHDYLLQFIQGIIELVFFYHPVVWWLSSVVNAEREHICDDLAVKICGESLTLIKALNNMEAIRKKQYEMVLGFSGKKGKVLKRIQRIIRSKASTNPRRERFMLSGVFTILFAGLFLISNFAISENLDSQQAFFSKINILDKTTDQVGKSIQNDEKSDQEKKKKDKKQTEIIEVEVELNEVSEVSEVNELTEVAELEMPSMPPLPSALEMTFETPEFNFPKDSVKSDKWVKMKADEIIKEQLEKMKLAEKEMKDVKIDLDVDQMRKDLQEGLKDLDFNSVEFQNEMKEQKIEIDKQLKELSDGSFAKKQDLQKKELENHLKEIEENSEINKKEKEQLKANLKETLEQLNSKEFQDQLSKQLQEAKNSLEQHRAEFESGEFENRMKEQRENIEQELKKIESPDFQEKINQQLQESKTKIQEEIQRINSDEYRKELEESIKKSPKARRGLTSYHYLRDPDKEPLIILDGKEITRSQRDQIPPSNIESINVAKNKSTIEKYGQKGKNGVVEITTKSQNPTEKGASHSAENEEVVVVGYGHASNSDAELKKIVYASKKGNKASDKQPLIILDGKKVGNEEMKNIPPDAIESISVLKGEAAIAIYGKESENGVILITSKSSTKIEGSHLDKIDDVVVVGSGSMKNPDVMIVGHGFARKKEQSNNKKESFQSSTTKNPLYVVDGKKLSNKEIRVLDKNDIESISVLKDKAAITAYGEKGANGVVLISSKAKSEISQTAVKMKIGSGKNSPLFIVDGKKMSGKKAENIDPNNIESIDVLKGQNAIEQYGKKAKNGVVKITLKK